MRIGVDRHDRVTKIVLDEGEILATGSVVAVDVGLLSEDGPELSVGVRTDHFLLDVLNKFVFVLLKVSMLLFDLECRMHSSILNS